MAFTHRHMLIMLVITNTFGGQCLQSPWGSRHGPLVKLLEHFKNGTHNAKHVTRVSKGINMVTLYFTLSKNLCNNRKTEITMTTNVCVLILLTVLKMTYVSLLSMLQVLCQMYVFVDFSDLTVGRVIAQESVHWRAVLSAT